VPTRPLRRHSFSDRPVGVSPRRFGVTPRELEGRLARLRDEIVAHEGSGQHNAARLAWMACELEQIDRERAALWRLVVTAPTLREVVVFAEQSASSALMCRAA